MPVVSFDAILEVLPIKESTSTLDLELVKAAEQSTNDVPENAQIDIRRENTNRRSRSRQSLSC